MKILFCPQVPASRALGGAKVIVELADEMACLGWDCEIVSIPEIRGSIRNSYESPLDESEALREYLIKFANSYDVIDYDHHFLPYSRETFSSRPLFVARAVLLAHHFLEIAFPTTLANRLTSPFFRKRRGSQRIKNFHRAQVTVQEAELVNVANQRDRETLVRYGIPEQKIVVLPYAIDAARRLLFDAISDAVPSKPKIVFVGTFDFRKGCTDFPKIFLHIAKRIPELSFRLLGTAGVYQTESEVRAFFPSFLQEKIEILPRYAPEDLPALLSECSVGIFPSYIEGFGFGVIEMLAAAIPVFAYDSPGPSDILSRESLVSPGDTGEIARKVVHLLQTLGHLHAERISARARSQKFRWSEIASKTSSTYLEFIRKKHDAPLAYKSLH